MTYVYLDESGDLGMDSKRCRYFIITAVRIEDEGTKLIFERIPRKVRKKTLGKHASKTSEMKFSNTTELTRKRYLEKVAELDVKIYSVIIDKRCTNDRLKNNLPILYNYLIKILLEKTLTGVNRRDMLKIFLDRCMSPKQRENFENYIKTEFLYLFRDIPELKITHENSLNNEGLQVTDFVSGAFGYKYNTASLGADSENYTAIIKKRIRIEKNDLFKNPGNKNMTNPA